MRINLVPSHEFKLSLREGSLSNEDGNANDGGSKNHISDSLFTSLCGSLGICFFALNFVNRKTIKCFFHEI